MSDERTERIRPTQVAASALAAVTAAVLGSTMGVAGTVIGAGLASIVTTVGGVLYLRSIERTKEGVRQVRTKAVTRAGHTTVTVTDHTPPATSPAGRPGWPRPPAPAHAPGHPTHGPRRPPTRAASVPDGDSGRTSVSGQLPTGDLDLTPVSGQLPVDDPDRTRLLRRPPAADPDATHLLGPSPAANLGPRGTRPPGDPDRTRLLGRQSNDPQQTPSHQPKRSRKRTWVMAAAGSLVAFVVGMGVITGVEMLRGEPLSGGDGTTLGTIVTPRQAEQRDQTPPPATTTPPSPEGAPESGAPSGAETTERQPPPAGGTSVEQPPESTPPPSDPPTTGETPSVPESAPPSAP